MNITIAAEIREVLISFLPWALSALIGVILYFERRDRTRAEAVARDVQGRLVAIEIKLQQVDHLHEFRNELLDWMRRIEDKIDRKADKP